MSMRILLVPAFVDTIAGAAGAAGDTDGVSLVTVVFVQFDPVTAKLYDHTPKPLSVTERPPSVRFPPGTQAGTL